MCTVALSPVARVCGPNNPGNILLYIENDENVLDYPDRLADSSVLDGAITMVDDPGNPGTPIPMKRLVFTPKTFQHTEEQNEAGGVNGTLTMRFDHDDDAKRYLFGQLPNGTYTVVWTDGNDLTKSRQEVEFSRNFDSGTADADVNGYTVNMTYTGQEADLYSGAIPT